MKQNGYGYTSTNWLLRVQDLLLCPMFLIHAMVGGGICCLEYALIYLLTLNELSGKQDAVQEPFLIQIHLMICSVS